MENHTLRESVQGQASRAEEVGQQLCIRAIFSTIFPNVVLMTFHGCQTATEAMCILKKNGQSGECTSKEENTPSHWNTFTKVAMATFKGDWESVCYSQVLVSRKMTSDVRCTGKQGTKKAKGHLLQGLSLGPYLQNANIQEQKPKGVESVQSLYFRSYGSLHFPQVA